MRKSVSRLAFVVTAAVAACSGDGTTVSLKVALDKDAATYFTRQTAYVGAVQREDGSFGLAPGGSSAPKAQFATAGIERGANAQAFGIAGVVADGKGGVAIARGQVLERIAALEHGLEVSWTFPAELAGSGDALVRVKLSGLSVTGAGSKQTLLRVVESGLDLRVGEAKWIDASGKSTSISQEVANGVLAFRVPAALLAASKYPAVLDPVISPARLGAISVAPATPSGQYDLTVGASGPGSVASSDAAISCGSTCTASYAPGTVVTLTATPDASAKFVGWSGICYGQSTCSVTMSEAQFVYAYFEPGAWPVKVFKTGEGDGAIAGDIDCPIGQSTCTIQVPNTTPPTSVTFTAAPDGTSVFAGWSQDCGGTGDCAITVDRPKNAYAAFQPANLTVTVYVDGAAGSSVSGPSGFTCASSTGCAITVPYTAPAPQVVLTASPDVTFINWGGDCAGWDTTCTVTVNGNKIVNAFFQSKLPGSIGYSDEATDSGMHFDPNAEPWSYPSATSGACVRCHTHGGFQDYMGKDGKPNYLESTFLANGTSFSMGPMRCATCHDPLTNPIFNRVTSVEFVSLARVDNLDGATALCSQCHQGRESTPSVNSKITANLSTSTARGLGIVSVTASAAGSTSTVVKSGFTANAYAGYTLLFTNNANQGQQVLVTSNDATTITFSPAVAAATASGDTATLWPTATGGGADDSTNAAKGNTMPAIDRGVSLVDANRAWTANQWASYILFMQTGANAGLYRTITGNTATTLTVATNSLSSGMPFPTPIAAGDRYLILPKEDTSGTSELDKVSASISFSNIHYLAASATLHGADARIGFQNPGNWGSGTLRVSAASSYSPKNLHGVSQDKCTSCHDQHTGKIAVNSATCGRCHFKEDGSPVSSFTELEETRQFGFDGDIDGDGAEESMKDEIAGLAGQLFQAIQNYATLKSTPICYDAATNPYFFKDNGTGGGTAGNGVCEPGELASTNQYGQSGSGAFTPRLLRATYNYQYWVKEPGAWAHNPRYMIQVLFDSIKDLNQILPATASASTGGQVGYACVDAAGVRYAMDSNGGCSSGGARTFTPQRSFGSGHFAGASNPLRFRDTTVNTAGGFGYPCLRCHSGQQGLEAYYGQSTFFDETAPYAAAVAPVQGFQCTTCHTPRDTDTDMKRLRDISATPVGGVRFPGHLASGTILPASYTVVLDSTKFAKPGDMICSSCHMSRDINGAAYDKYLDGTWSGFDVAGSAFLGTGTITAGAGGNIHISGLPAYQAPGPKGTPNNWLSTNGTSCAAVGKFITISGSANYNGTWTIASCTASGQADLNKAYVADESGIGWTAWAAGTKNAHDIQGAARVYGGDGQIGYQYAGKTYAGRKQHHGATASCLECHSPIASRHSMEVSEVVAAGKCASCHTGADYTSWARSSIATGAGYDGDATTTTLQAELTSFRNALGAAMNAYQRAAGVQQAGGNLCWSDAAGAFRTEAGNVTGVCVSSTTSWSTWNAKLGRANFNMIFTSLGSDPGAPWHNFDYLAELLYDSAQDLNGGAPVTNGAFTLTRP